MPNELFIIVVKVAGLTKALADDIVAEYGLATKIEVAAAEAKIAVIEFVLLTIRLI